MAYKQHIDPAAVNPFKNAVGVWITKSLFFEEAAGTEQVVYTLKDQDYNGYPSLFRLYQETNDPTEYAVATQHLGGVEHWEYLCRSNWFKPHLERMRRSLELKLKSEAIRSLVQDANSNSKTATASAKYILDKGYGATSPDKRRAGRPSKAEIAAAAADELSIGKSISDDHKRILTLVRNDG